MNKEKMDLIEKIETLRANKVEDDKIKIILELDTDVETIITNHEINKELRTVEQTAEQLKAALGEQKEKFNYHKVLRLIKSGELKSFGKTSNKEGIKIHINEINRFIEDRKMTLEDWKERALRAEEELKRLKGQL